MLRNVSRFLQSALARNEATILIATPEHRTAFYSALAAAGHDLQTLRASEQLLALDAQSCLDVFMVENMPDADRFKRLIDPLLKKAISCFGTVAAFGEMVNLLWKQGHVLAAVRLEELWNEAIGRIGFCLMCSYHLDPLNESWENLQQIYRCHSHIDPIDDIEQFQLAVERALGEVLGPDAAKELWQLIVGALGAVTSPSHAVLCWLREKMPMTAEALLLRIKQYYRLENASPEMH